MPEGPTEDNDPETYGPRKALSEQYVQEIYGDRALIMAARAYAAMSGRDFVTPDDIKEIIMQQAIYCGVPAANHAFKEAAEVIAEIGKK
jgi:hypothetical protein